MIRHVFKMVWNRKRSNALIVVEIFISFLVVFAVAALAVFHFGNVRRPLGFTYQDVWDVSIHTQRSTDDEWSPEQAATIERLLGTLRQLDGVEGVAGAHTVPFSFGASTGSSDRGGRHIQYERSEVTDDFVSVLSLTVTRGRFFSKEDDGASYQPVVLNERAVPELFPGGEDPVGRRISADDDAVERRVVGVISEYRRAGDYSSPAPFVLHRTRIGDPKSRPPGHLLVKLRPGTPRAFEETLMATLLGVAKEWTFTVQPLAESRASMQRLRLAPIVVVSLVAAFLLLMVALGLTGVLWQTVTQRTREIGLRRAKGATAGDIYRQILGEIWIITAFGLALGTAVVVQLPLLALFGSVSAGVYAEGWAIAVLAVLALTTVCGLYPAHLATRVQPAAALHYD